VAVKKLSTMVWKPCDIGCLYSVIETVILFSRERLSSTVNMHNIAWLKLAAST